jgi:CxxC motif-containing protein
VIDDTGRDVTVAGVAQPGDPGDPSPGHRDPEDTVTAYLCIGCPLGCRLEVEESVDHEVVEVRGFSCKRGERFAIQEHTDPRRTVTTTVAIEDGPFPRLPVRTDDPAPKGLVRQLCEELRGVTVSAPVAMGDVVLADALGTGIDVVATRDVERSSP